MSSKLPANLLIAFYGLMAVLQPVVHEVFCPVDGILAGVVRGDVQSSTELSRASCSLPQTASSEGILVGSADWEEHCDGDCLASLVQTSSSWTPDSGLEFQAFSRTESGVALPWHCLLRVSLERVRGPPMA